MVRRSSAWRARTVWGRERHQNRPCEHDERCELYTSTRLFVQLFNFKGRATFVRCISRGKIIRTRHDPPNVCWRLDGSSIGCSFCTDVADTAHATENQSIFPTHAWLCCHMPLRANFHLGGRPTFVRCTLRRRSQSCEQKLLSESS